MSTGRARALLALHALIVLSSAVPSGGIVSSSWSAGMARAARGEGLPSRPDAPLRRRARRGRSRETGPAPGLDRLGGWLRLRGGSQARHLLRCTLLPRRAPTARAHLDTFLARLRLPPRGAGSTDGAAGRRKPHV